MSAAEVPACLGVAVGVLVACITLAARAVWQRRRPVLRYPVGQDATHPRPDVAPRPVPPVVPPPDAPRPTVQVAGIWGPDVLEIPHTVRQYPYVDWQAKIQERRN